jgi:hypothetical protein
MNSKGNPRNEKVDIDLDEAYASLLPCIHVHVALSPSLWL